MADVERRTAADLGVAAVATTAAAPAAPFIDDACATNSEAGTADAADD